LECLKKSDKKDGEILDKGRKVMERKRVLTITHFESLR
jgi:hypothetical protein